MQFLGAHFISYIEIISHQLISYILWCLFFSSFYVSVKLIILFFKVNMHKVTEISVFQVFVPFAYCFYLYLCFSLFCKLCMNNNFIFLLFCQYLGLFYVSYVLDFYGFYCEIYKLNYKMCSTIYMIFS